ncbi:MAG: hypothetical protein Q9171_002433 [Xanthocarpia ochracea]
MNSLPLLQSSRVPSETKADLDSEAREGTISNSIALDTEKTVPLDALEFNANGRDATEDEINTLRHVTDRIPLAAWIVILAGAAERATYFGVIAPWHIYIGRYKSLIVGLAYVEPTFAKRRFLWG